jgi:signal peptidase I
MDNNQAFELFKKIYIKFLDISQAILFFVVILLGLYMFVIQPHEVTGSSMYPTFKDKELVLSYLLDVDMHNIKHGDVVVFHAPTEEDKLYIKRVIGLPGDRVALRNGIVYLNGEKLDESEYLDASVATYGGSYLSEGKEITISSGKLFVMGDNRQYSSDSRAWGMLSYSKLIGRSMLRFWPPHTLTLVMRDPYK